jgi:citronellol/citronellal dehydrogenase
MKLSGKTVLITGGGRGIGKAVALRLAKEGANIAIVGKTVAPHPKLDGTIYSAAEEIAAAGNVKVLPLEGDIRNDERIKEVIEATAAEFGGIDILVNNASAINLYATEQMEEKRYDLMQDINVRGTFFMSKYAVPYLKKAVNPHILNMSPPINLDPGWFGKHLAYTISKYGMSMVVLGLSEELKKDRIGVNALWPRTTIATAAVRNLLGGDFLVQRSRRPEIVADAAFFILTQPSFETTGNFFIDEDVLKQNGVEDFTSYAINPDQKLMPDLFL